jgi:RHS repeat-associated protein
MISAGKRIARRDVSTNAVRYYFSDHLGSISMVENATGTACEQDIDYYPYGGAERGNCPNVVQNYRFTGKERDAESGLDFFGARYYGSALGRFTTPDWSLDPAMVPYANFGDPQTLNQYSYMRNNPLARADLDGHGDWWERVKNCFRGFCGFTDKQKKDLEKKIEEETKIKREAILKTCPRGCLGQTPSEIQKMSPQQVQLFYEDVQVAVQWMSLMYGGWTSWANYAKVTINGKEYAEIGGRYYSEHAVERMMPRGLTTNGRSISPEFVEEVIKTGTQTTEIRDGVPRVVHSSGSVEVVTENGGQIVVTVMTK